MIETENFAASNVDSWVKAMQRVVSVNLSTYQISILAYNLSKNPLKFATGYLKTLRAMHESLKRINSQAI